MMSARMARFRRRFWSAQVDALERHLDRLDRATRNAYEKEEREDDAAQTANVTKEKP